MAGISVRELRKSFGAVEVIRGVDLEVNDGEFLALLGPSGCGKTSLLRLLSGLEAPHEGSVRIGGTDVSKIPPRGRGVGFVFQSFALYAHLTVRGNMEHPLRVERVPRAERSGRVEAMARALSIEALLERRPERLSGGEAQRVALGRALVKNPRVLLLDEPLSNVDEWQARQLRATIRRLQVQRRITTIYVTHDQRDALALADRVAVMSGGRILQVGTPAEIMEQPATAFVALFMGEPPMNLLSGTLRGAGDSTCLQLLDKPYELPEAGMWTVPGARQRPTSAISVGIRPYHVRVGRPDSPGRNIVEMMGRMTVAQYVPPLWSLEVTTAAGPMAILDSAQPDHRDGEVALWFDLRNAVLLPNDFMQQCHEGNIRNIHDEAKLGNR